MNEILPNGEIWHRPEFQNRRGELINKQTAAALVKVKPNTLSSWQQRYDNFPKTVLTFTDRPQHLLHKGEFLQWHHWYSAQRGQRGKPNYIGSPVPEQTEEALHARLEALQTRREALLKQVDGLDIRIGKAAAALEHLRSAAHPGASIAAEDPRPRTEVWAQRLTPQRWFQEWPAAMRERLLAAIVKDEHIMVTDELKDLQEATTATFEPDWRWEPDQGHLYATVPHPSTEPDLDAYLEAAQQHLRHRLRRIEATVAFTWLTDLIVNDEHPEQLRRLTNELWQRYGDHAPHGVRPVSSEREDRLTDKIRVFATNVYPPGSHRPEVPAMPLPESVPAWFAMSVADAFPHDVPQQVDVNTEPGPDAQAAPDAAREVSRG